ncbi:exodeoxyribonuclease V subunit beta [Aliamphritea ceti]|uniref:exodeoxyribonuclease V subunit beta n=1 Tax=Aliamphritea ceti TaxID=1524258 RepID=UPI0021C3F2FA|nr:exodeoxyribonuclease V subunit beta [Aliamphritea ceti]
MTDLIASNVPEQLNPLTFPLHGQRLIEASAGTGKTFTIAALYLRLLLGHGDEKSRREIPLSVDQILVVTFTEAATEELRERIRARIQQAQQAFLAVAGDGSLSDDPILRQLLIDQGDAEEQLRAAKLLELAARQMDEAAIFTIHGFCQRMLKQHAFESGALFATELLSDDADLRRQALLDTWRSLSYCLPEDLTEALLYIWPTPDRYMKTLRPYLGQTEAEFTPDCSGYDLLAGWKDYQQKLTTFRQQWLANETDLVELIQTSGVNKNSYRKASVPKYIAVIDSFARGDIRQVPEAEIQRFRQSVLASKTPAAKAVPEHPLFMLCDEFFDWRLPLREILIHQGLEQLNKRFSQLKNRLSVLSFDDLLSNLDRALQRDEHNILSNRIAEQYPVALIDEFQDTDPLQYRIFSRLYGDSSETGLFMIGDPKQAIYGFRGADIFTYIQARRSVKAHYTLGTNWRSSSQMINGVNSLFNHHDAPFMYNRDIPFQAVAAANKADKTPFTLAGQQQTALNLWFGEQDLLSKKAYLNNMAQACAGHIADVLAAAARGEALIGDQPVAAKDIAILVRDRTEANAVRQALAGRAVASVYLSGRESVFNSQEAVDLNLILQAIQHPQDERRLRAALATGLLDYPASFLERLSRDEQLWEALVAEFTAYHECWLSLGILPMLRRLLSQRQLAEQLLAGEQGERRLTDVLHLGEILQRVSLEQDSMTSLMRWFADQLLQPNGESDEQRLRLESDRALVTVITVHKSKGLEYPLVYLPFACTFKPATQASYHDDNGQYKVDLTDADDAIAAADKERLAEDVRLLYVALTRSVYACYVGLANLQDGRRKASGLARSALGYLLLQGDVEKLVAKKAADMPDLDAQLESLRFASGGAIAVTEPPKFAAAEQQSLFADEIFTEGFTDELPVSGSDELNQPEARTFSRRLLRNWRISSYSGLTSHSSHSLPNLPGLDLEVAAEASTDSVADAEPVFDIFTFHKGAQAGTFLHEIFESVDFTDYRTADVAELLEARSQVMGYGPEWLPVLPQLLDDVLQCPLDPANGLTLGQISNAQRLVEMEFMLPSEGLNAAGLNALVARHDALSQHAAPLDFMPLKGMLKGFVDLIFEYQGRYYILDYKSNHLGSSLEDYTPEKLDQAMLEHRYDLQYQLYALALHRLLESRLPGYSYEEHFGGAYYLFLRGMRAGIPGYGVFYNRPSLALVTEMDALFKGELSTAVGAELSSQGGGNAVV